MTVLVAQRHRRTSGLFFHSFLELHRQAPGAAFTSPGFLDQLRCLGSDLRVYARVW